MELTTYQWLTLLGIPTLISLIVGVVFNAIMGKSKTEVRKIKALMLGMQSLLRNNLYHCYDYCEKKGYATLHERENFQQMYSQYEKLGENGVMDDIKKKFFAMPVKGEDR